MFVEKIKIRSWLLLSKVFSLRFWCGLGFEEKKGKGRSRSIDRSVSRRKEEKKKKKKKRKKKVFLYVLKVLCWKSLKSKGVKHLWLKMKNLWALMEYLVWSIIFQNALLSLVWTFPFTFFYLTLTSALLQPENKTFWFM